MPFTEAWDKNSHFSAEIFVGISGVSVRHFDLVRALARSVTIGAKFRAYSRLGITRTSFDATLAQLVETSHVHFTDCLGGQTCLAGDVIGGFCEKTSDWDPVIIDDLSLYTMEKISAFNGMGLPCLATYDSRNGALEIVTLVLAI